MRSWGESYLFETERKMERWETDSLNLSSQKIFSYRYEFVPAPYWCELVALPDRELNLWNRKRPLISGFLVKYFTFKLSSKMPLKAKLVWISWKYVEIVLRKFKIWNTYCFRSLYFDWRTFRVCSNWTSFIRQSPYMALKASEECPWAIRFVFRPRSLPSFLWTVIRNREKMSSPTISRWDLIYPECDFGRIEANIPWTLNNRSIIVLKI